MPHNRLSPALIVVFAIVFVGGGILWTNATTGADSDPSRDIQSFSEAGQTGDWSFTADGRLESAGGLRRLGTQMNGVIEAMSVNEGDTVRKGQIVARIGCEDRRAQAAAAEAQAEAAKDDYTKAKAGNRIEDIRTGEAALAKAEATLTDARSSAAKLSALKGMVSVRSIEIAKAAVDGAAADAARARAQLQELRKGVRPEDLARALATLQAATANRDAAAALAKQCSIVAPIDGLVTKVNLRAGEQVSQFSPIDVIEIVDLARMQVRAEIDERYVDRVKIGQHVEFWLEGSNQRFQGIVVRMSGSMGHKSTFADAPTDKADRDIREIIIAPAGGDFPRLNGIRVVVGFKS
ncbi:MAG TPA: HlyD family efflux transporter periplasmic adaptor subunit [Rhizomicrobium sp.]|jgi:multidrug resistance efflux pump|nr:HlyD family efflux transporter periplasmic adaptor subunit [Rhizomicrobium sp.]